MVAVLFGPYSNKYSNQDPLLIFLSDEPAGGEPAVLDPHYLHSGDFD